MENTTRRKMYLCAFDLNGKMAIGVYPEEEVAKDTHNFVYKKEAIEYRIDFELKHDDLRYFNFTRIINDFDLFDIELTEPIFEMMIDEFINNVAYANFVTNEIESYLIEYHILQDEYEYCKRDEELLIEDLIKFYNFIMKKARIELERKVLIYKGFEGSITSIGNRIMSDLNQLR